MKKLAIVLCFAFAAVCSNGQSVSDCEGAIVLCDDFYSEENASLNIGNIYEFTGTCNLDAEVSSVWYTFTVQEDGLLSFVLTPNNLMDDYDWGLFEITSGGCQSIGTNLSPEVSCNSWGTAFGQNGPTGIATSLGGLGNSNGPGDLNGPPFNADLPVQEGEVFALVVMNWTNSLEGYSINFGGSTATLFDDVPPSILSADIDCSNQEIVLVLSEEVVDASVQPSDFLLSGPGGDFTISSVEADDPGASQEDTYYLTLSEQVPTGGTYTLTITNLSGFVTDNCGNLGEDTFELVLQTPLSFQTNTVTACNGFGGSLEVVSISGGLEPFSCKVQGEPGFGCLYEDLDAGSYTVTVTDAADCSSTLSVVVPNHEISVLIGLQDSLTCLNPEVTMQNVEVTPPQDPLYLWETASDGASLVSGANSVYAVVNQPGTYQLTVTDPISGCGAEGLVEVFTGEVFGLDLGQLVLPNVITPNGDGTNDQWNAYLGDDPEFKLAEVMEVYALEVYNRWGQLLYEGSGTNAVWNGGDVSDGAYFAVFRYRTFCGGLQEGEKSFGLQVLR